MYHVHLSEFLLLDLLLLRLQSQTSNSGVRDYNNQKTYKKGESVKLSLFVFGVSNSKSKLKL
jgi:hypothetical protein